MRMRSSRSSTQDTPAPPTHTHTQKDKENSEFSPCSGVLGPPVSSSVKGQRSPLASEVMGTLAAFLPQVMGLRRTKGTEHTAVKCHS